MQIPLSTYLEPCGVLFEEMLCPIFAGEYREKTVWWKALKAARGKKGYPRFLKLLVNSSTVCLLLWPTTFRSASPFLSLFFLLLLLTVHNTLVFHSPCPVSFQLLIFFLLFFCVATSPAAVFFIVVFLVWTFFRLGYPYFPRNNNWNKISLLGEADFFVFLQSSQCNFYFLLLLIDLLFSQKQSVVGNNTDV